MNVEELRNHIEARGYEVRSIRVFRNSFHVNVWTPEYKMMEYFKRPLQELTWEQLESRYPQIGE